MKKLIAWVEIPTVNFERAVAFYCAVLELELEALDFGSEKMACFPSGEGAIIFAPGFIPSSDGVLVSFDTGTGLDSTLERILQHGGKIVIPKTKIQAENRGWFAVFSDCEGNKLGLYGDQ
ncbi:MAG TPA: VOC family protein [Bacteroidales bacterium]|nr:VOC family protein [Bacteroidales bacterium]